jgi:hypothetical protein
LISCEKDEIHVQPIDLDPSEKNPIVASFVGTLGDALAEPEVKDLLVKHPKPARGGDLFVL